MSPCVVLLAMAGHINHALAATTSFASYAIYIIGSAAEMLI